MGNDFHDYESTEKEKNELNTEDIENDTAPIGLDNIEGRNKVEEECKENEKGVSEEEAYIDEQENSSCEKETSAYEEAPYAGEKELYYQEKVGTWSNIDPEPQMTTKSKSGKGCIITSAVAVILAFALFIATLFPAFMVNVGLIAVNGVWGIGNVLDSIFNVQVNNGEDGLLDDTSELHYDGDREDMNVIKNDGSIDVNEQIGSTGYPGNLSVAEVVKNVADTVVEITTTNVVTDRFYGQYITSGAGSGVIISENGYIITNHHVIDGARTITVRLTDGSEFSAKLVGSDADTDIAVLKIQATGLSYAVMGSSASLVVGQEVVAIGNPLGSLGGTVTDGIISALDRTVVVDGHKMTLMQTNAAINPGNSGGGLFNRAGELIGIVNAKQADTGIEGLGFAVPIDVAWASVEAIVNKK